VQNLAQRVKRITQQAQQQGGVGYEPILCSAAPPL
jgi:hypothetical protein